MKKVVILLITILIISTGCSVKKVEDVKENEKFADQFGISTDNVFTYSNIDEILEKLDNGNCIIYLADPDDDWSRAGAKMLRIVTSEEDISNVYYYNPKKIASKYTEKYQKLVSKLSDIAYEDEEGYKKIELPVIINVKDGNITDVYTTFSEIKKDAIEYLTKKNKNKILNEIRDFVKSDNNSNEVNS